MNKEEIIKEVIMILFGIIPYICYFKTQNNG